MSGPTLETIAERLSRLERESRLLRWVSTLGLLTAVALVVFMLLTRSAPTVSPGTARYAVTSPQPGMLYRLDTMTGEVAVFMYGPEKGLRRVQEYEPFTSVELGRVPPATVEKK